MVSFLLPSAYFFFRFADKNYLFFFLVVADALFFSFLVVASERERVNFRQLSQIFTDTKNFKEIIPLEH